MPSGPSDPLYSRKDFRRGSRQALGDTRWTATRAILLIFLGIILVGAGSFVVKVIFWPARVAEIVTDPNRAIYTYEWFHETYQGIEAKERQIAVLQAQLDGTLDGLPEDVTQWPFQTSQVVNQLRGQITGVTSARLQQIAAYNANSNMVTRDIFQGTSLPEQIPLD